MNPQQHYPNVEAPNVNARDPGSGVALSGRASISPPDEAFNLDELRVRCLGNLELVQRVLMKLQQRIPEELAEMEKALECGDTKLVARIAHRVKGTSVSVSAGGLARAAAEIEDLGRAGLAADISARLELLRNEWEKCLNSEAMSLTGDVVV